MIKIKNFNDLKYKSNDNNILINDDCFKIFPLLEDNSVDLVFTSPPYNRKRNDKYKYYDDIIEGYFKFLSTVINESLRISKKHVILNVQKNFYNKTDIFKIIGLYNRRIQEIFIWEKTNPLPAAGNAITNSYEFFIFLGNHPVKSNTTYTKNIISSSVNSNMPKEHKAVMKQEISDFFIEKFSVDGDIILDCFMGIGTTGISCNKFNRKFVGIEMNEKYYDMSTTNVLSNNNNKSFF